MSSKTAQNHSSRVSSLLLYIRNTSCFQISAQLRSFGTVVSASVSAHPAQQPFGNVFLSKIHLHQEIATGPEGELAILILYRYTKTSFSRWRSNAHPCIARRRQQCRLATPFDSETNFTLLLILHQPMHGFGNNRLAGNSNW